MPTPSASVTFWAVPYGTSTVIAIGNVVMPDTSGGWVVATSANRTAIGRRSEGIAVTSFGGSGLGTVEIWQTGTIDATISGLAAGSASWVRCSATGTIERFMPSFGGTSDIIGYAEADGRVHLIMGTLTESIAVGGGASPGGAVGDFQRHSPTHTFEGIAPEGVYVADYGAVGDGVTDDSGAFRQAIAAAATGRKVVLAPKPTSSYYFASKVVVNQPVWIFGTRNYESTITLAAGLESAFTVVPANVAGGSGADGGGIVGFTITCNPSLTTVAYAPTTAYTVGQLIKRSSGYTPNCYVYEVIKAGTTASDSEATAFTADPHVPDRATTWTAGMTVVAGQAVRTTSNANWDRIFIAGGAGTTGGSEPTWNTTDGGTTSDNGITWTCDATTGNTTIVLGTVICKVRLVGALYVTCQRFTADVVVNTPALAGVTYIGNSTNPTINSNAQGCKLTLHRCTLASGGKSVAVYTRGGEFRDLDAWVDIVGSSSFEQGSTALPTDGTQNEHGILDYSFAGANRWMGRVTKCSGYDVWAAGTASTSVFRVVSNGGRVRIDAGALWAGASPTGVGSFWNSNGNQLYGGATTALSSTGLKNAYELYGTVYAGLNNGTSTFWEQDVIDSGVVGWRTSGGWRTYSWAAASYGSFATSNAQVPNSTNLPRGEVAGALVLPRGYGLGQTDDYGWCFPSVAVYKSNIRGYYRRAGDLVFRPDRATSGGYLWDIVTAAGYTGPPWSSGTAKSARVAPPGSTAHVADFIVANVGGTDYAFECTTSGTTGGSLPAFSAVLNATTADNTIVWTNRGPAATLDVAGYVGTLPGGGGEANTASTAGGDVGLTLTKSGVDLPFKGLTAGSNVTLTDLGDAIQIDASGGGGGGSSAGSAGAVQVSDGAGGFSDPGNVAAGSSYVAIGATPATAGKIRLPYAATDTVIGAKDSGGTDRAILSRVAADWWSLGTFGPYFNFDIEANNLNLEGYNSVTIRALGGAVFATDGVLAKFAKPLTGNGTPLQIKSTSVAIVTGAFSPADLTIPIVVLTGTTIVGSGFLELSTTADAVYWVWNQTSTTIGVRKVGSSSTTINIAPGKSGMFWNNGTDYLPLGCPNGGA